jgi:hypothetical protein
MHSIRTPRQTTYFCLNYPSGAIERLERCVKQHSYVVHRNLFLDTLAADDSMKQWQYAIGQRREALHVHVGSARTLYLGQLLTIDTRKEDTRTKRSIMTQQRENYIVCLGIG